MKLDNYRNISKSGSGLDGGFQFEFFCNNCSRTWKSPFKPYRRGQLQTLLGRFSWAIPQNYRQQAAWITGANNEMGSGGAEATALAAATKQAAELFHVCPTCSKGMCTDCYDESDSECAACREAGAKNQHRERLEESSRVQYACPNCSAPRDGGRFCAECGFDLASTHKSCPACSAQMPRQARFCTDCGHSF